MKVRAWNHLLEGMRVYVSEGREIKSDHCSLVTTKTQTFAGPGSAELLDRLGLRVEDGTLEVVFRDAALANAPLDSEEDPLDT
jgi:hypothetical protein